MKPGLASAFVLFLACSFAHAAQPTVQPLLAGKWPATPRWGGEARDVKVVGNYAYAALYEAAGLDSDAALQVFDVSNPSNVVRVATCGFRDYPTRIAINHRYAFMAERDTGLNVLDLTECKLIGGYKTKGYLGGVTVADDRIYLAASEEGFIILPTLPNVQFTVRPDATPLIPLTVEASRNLNAPWTPLVTTNALSMPFDFVDFDVNIAEKPHKFYRARQP